MDNQSIDANPEAASSSASTSASESATDAIGVSSTPSSNASTGAKSGQSMESVIADAFKKSTKGASPTPDAKEVSKEDAEETEEAKTPEEDVPTKEDEDKEDSEGESESKDDTEDSKDKDAKEKSDKAEEKGPVPYERFQEVVAKRQELDVKLKQLEPIAMQHGRIVDYCSSNNITQEQFSQALEITALMNTDPVKALEKLTPLVNDLQGITGNKLPEDLQTDVDSGDISLTRAKEIAQLRAQQKFGEARSQHTAQQIRQQREQEFQHSLTTAAQSWETAKRTQDPDYKPKAKPDGRDGKWELTRDKFLALLHQQDTQGQFTNPVRTPQEMSALLEQAYQRVSETFNSLQSARRPIKALTRSGSSTTLPKSPNEAKSIEEAMQLAAAKHGY